MRVPRYVVYRKTKRTRELVRVAWPVSAPSLAHARAHARLHAHGAAAGRLRVVEWPAGAPHEPPAIVARHERAGFLRRYGGEQSAARVDSPRRTDATPQQRETGT